MCCNNKHNHSGCFTDLGRGACFCNCADEATASACEGCYKLHTTDWLEGMPENFPDDIMEVRFKNTRRGYYRNVNGLDLKRGDIVAVEASPGHDVGIVSLTGDMVARQMKRVGFNPQNGEFKKIYRKVKPYDIEKWQEAIAMEHETMIAARQIAAGMNLNMKIGDVEYQGDKIKAIFYYIADERVDFRELIKVFADRFRIRVEMKQIGARQEAGRIGGLGACGRELCCASWMSSFVSVTTNAARTQEISLNPQKLAGQCSKLKCCMIYELDTYMDARKDFPRVNQPLQALDGEYHLVKNDILARTMSFSTVPNSMVGVVTIPVSRVREILEINRRGKKVDKLQDESYEPPRREEPDFVNVIGEDSITRFDKSRRKDNRGRKGGKGRDNRAESAPEANRQDAGKSNNGAGKQEQGRGDNGGRQNGPRRDQRRPQRPGGEKAQNAQNPERGDGREKGGNANTANQRSQGQHGGQGGQRNNRNRRQGKPTQPKPNEE